MWMCMRWVKETFHMVPQRCRVHSAHPHLRLVLALPRCERLGGAIVTVPLAYARAPPHRLHACRRDLLREEARRKARVVFLLADQEEGALC